MKNAKRLCQHSVPADIPPIRFSDYARQVFTQIPSRNGIRKAIKHGELTIDGKEAETDRWLQPGMLLELWESDRKPARIFPLKFAVIFQDEHLAVINKPAGFPVSGNRFRTIENALLHNISASKEPDALTNPKPVHRLDALTSGLLIIAKTTNSRIELGKQFEEKNIQKRYRAIVIGNLPQSRTIAEPIGGKVAITRFELVKAVPSLKSEWLSLVDLFPQTGRTHQLRIHLSKLGHPILGDNIYGEEHHIFKGKGLFLCAVELKFTHPITTKNLELKIDEPNKFKIHLEREEKRWRKYRG